MIGGAGLFAVSSACGSVVRSLVGAGGTNYVSDVGGDDFPYVKDGLIAMWDGEWNAGYGVHDPNANVWKDLSGRAFDFTYTPNKFIIEDKSLLGRASSLENFIILQNNYTIEIVSQKVITSYEGYTYNICWLDPICAAYRIRYWNASRVLISGGFQNSQVVKANGHLYDISSISWISNGSRNATPSANIRWVAWVRNCYYNGTVSTLDNHGNWNSNPSTENAESVIGDYGYDKDGVRGTRIFCIRIYDRALSDSERISNYLVDAERFGI